MPILSSHYGQVQTTGLTCYLIFSRNLAYENGSDVETPVSTAGLEMLKKLFPGKKRSVLELVLRRCNHDLLRAVEHFNATQVS